MLPYKILFITHDTSRTGAPLMLLNLLKWLKKSNAIEFKILAKYDGPLVHEFEKIAPTYRLNPQHVQVGSSLPLRAIRKARYHTVDRLYPSRLFSKLKNEKFDLIYSNTIANGELVATLKKYLNCPVVTHVHELQATIDLFGRQNMELVKQYTNTYIAASKAVQDNLIKANGIDQKSISLIHSFIAVSEFQSTAAQVREVRHELGIQDDAFVVGGAGTVEWRKGSDIFLLVAKQVLLAKPNANIYFVWVGNEQEKNIIKKIQYDLDLLGIADRVKFIGGRNHPVNYFAAFTVFFLASREDPYPLVCLENAALRKPLLCFDKAGGMAEFVTPELGSVLPYLDINAAADQVLALANASELVASKGQAAYQKVMKQHDIESVAPSVISVIKAVIE